MAKSWKKSLLVASLILNAFFIVLAVFYAIKHKESLTQKYIRYFNTETLIMFGDSHTANGNWNELLGRRDVLRMGFSGYTSGQLETVMKQLIVERNASYCFIQCGGNDLNKKGFDPKQLTANIGSMIQYLKTNSITPVLQSLFHRPDSAYNLTIDSLNLELSKLARETSIDFIDVNQYLHSGNGIGNHVLSDFIHLNQKGYEIWGRVIKDYLKVKDI